jgi:hypothetical protein
MHSASGLVVKSNVAIVGPRVRFSARAEDVFKSGVGSLFTNPNPHLIGSPCPHAYRRQILMNCFGQAMSYFIVYDDVIVFVSRVHELIINVSPSLID